MSGLAMMGAGLASALVAAGGGSTATFVDKLLAEADASSDASIAFATTSVSAGDYLIVAIANAAPGVTCTLNGTSTTMDVLANNVVLTDSRLSVFGKALQAGDISNGTISMPNSTSGDPVMSLVYRNCTAFAVKSTAESVNAGDTSLDLAGFAPDAATKGVAIGCFVGAGGSTGANATPTSLTNYVTRMSDENAPSGNWWEASAFDRLSGYTNATVTVGSFVSTSFSRKPIAFIGEFT